MGEMQSFIFFGGVCSFWKIRGVFIAERNEEAALLAPPPELAFFDTMGSGGGNRAGRQTLVVPHFFLLCIMLKAPAPFSLSFPLLMFVGLGVVYGSIGKERGLVCETHRHWRESCEVGSFRVYTFFEVLFFYFSYLFFLYYRRS